MRTSERVRPQVSEMGSGTLIKKFVGKNVVCPLLVCPYCRITRSNPMECSLHHLLVSILLTTATSSALATIVTPGVPSGAGGTATISVAPGSRGGLNHFEVAKNFMNLAPIDITFDAAPSGTAPASSQFITERIVNNTGVSWFDFHVEIGLGTGDNFRRMDPLINILFISPTGTPNECSSAQSTDFGVALGPNCGLTPFSTVTAGTALDFLSTSPDITAQNASAVENGHALNLSFAIQVPNAAQGFTLREIPTTDGRVRAVFEPSTIALMLAGMGALGYATRRRRGK